MLDPYEMPHSVEFELVLYNLHMSLKRVPSHKRVNVLICGEYNKI